MFSRRARPPTPPSRLVRGLARAGVPLGVVFGLLALAAVAALVLNLVVGGGAHRVILSVGWAVGLGSIAYSLGVELPRNVRAWDEALAERAALEEGWD